MKDVENLHDHGESTHTNGYEIMFQKQVDFCISALTEEQAKEKLLKIREFIKSDPGSFCENCEAMKCCGSLYPICEPVLDMLKEMLAHY